MVNTSELNPGQLVISKAGRDSGKKFLVIEVIDDLYVYLVDGDLRKAENPKKKKIKHIAKTNMFSEYISGKIDKSEKITNNMIRREIEKLDNSLIQE